MAPSKATLVRILARHPIDRSQIKTVKEIGKGQFGQVFLAVQTVNGKQVRRAVKILDAASGDSSRENDAAFLRENATQARLEHPNINKLVGVDVTSRPLMAVLELAEYGDLKSFLKALALHKFEVREAEKIHLSCQVAYGLEYLHKQRIVHRDIAARNILLSAKSMAKIGDFGHARVYDEGETSWLMTERESVSVQWAPIEVFASHRKRFNEKTDVWSFGVLMWEIFSGGSTPFVDISTSRVPIAIKSGVRLPNPACTDDMYKVMLNCWSTEPTERRTFEALKQYLLDERKDLLDNGGSDAQIRDFAGIFKARQIKETATLTKKNSTRAGKEQQQQDFVNTLTRTNKNKSTRQRASSGADVPVPVTRLGASNTTPHHQHQHQRAPHAVAAAASSDASDSGSERSADLYAAPQPPQRSASGPANSLGWKGKTALSTAMGPSHARRASSSSDGHAAVNAATPKFTPQGKGDDGGLRLGTCASCSGGLVPGNWYHHDKRGTGVCHRCFHLGYKEHKDEFFWVSTTDDIVRALRSKDAHAQHTAQTTNAVKEAFRTTSGLMSPPERKMSGIQHRQSRQRTSPPNMRKTQQLPTNIVLTSGSARNYGMVSHMVPHPLTTSRGLEERSFVRQIQNVRA